MLIAMIWRPTPDRQHAFASTNEFWHLMGHVKFFDSGHVPFNRAASRNMAVRWAEENGYSKLVITDADTIPEPAAVEAAFAAADDTGVRLPYNRCRVMDGQNRPVVELDFTCGGVYVTTTAAWWAAGGQDERFNMWGPEDFAFSLAHRTLLGEMPRTEGLLLSLAHDADPNRHTDREDDPLVALYREYERANGNPAAMRELIG